MPKLDPKKWKGRAVIDEEAEDMKRQAKEDAKRIKEMRDMAKELAAYKLQRAKEHQAKVKEKNFEKRVAQLNVFKALVSGVGSLQLRLTFTKWTEYVTLKKDERMEQYRRARWQLSCPDARLAILDRSFDPAERLHNAIGRRGTPVRYMEDMADAKGLMKYHVDGDEDCGASHELRSTHLPLLLPRKGGKLNPSKHHLYPGQLLAAAEREKGPFRGDQPSNMSGQYEDHFPIMGDDDPMWSQSLQFYGGSSMEELPPERKNYREMMRESMETEITLNARARSHLPVHQQYGFDPKIMRYDGRGFHFRNGRPVLLDEKFKLYKYAYE